MINPYSLLAMQYGGTAGGATLARALQQRSDADTLEEYQKAEAERQKRGRLFGSVGGLGAGLLGAALAPATGGLSLALASGVGTAFGKGVGERLGAGGARGVDRSGTVYGQKAFRDVAEASKEYNRGIAGRAGMAGLKAGLTAGLAPGGGMYGKVAGKLRPQDVLTASQAALPSASQAALEAGQQMGAEQGAGLTFGRGGDAISRSFGLSDPAQATQYLAPQGSVLDLAQQGQGFVSDPSAIIGDTAQAVSGGAAPLFGSLSEAVAARGAGDPRAQAIINQAYEGTGGDWAQAKQQFGSIFGVEDGGLIGYKDGDGVASDATRTAQMEDIFLSQKRPLRMTPLWEQIVRGITGTQKPMTPDEKTDRYFKDRGPVLMDKEQPVFVDPKDVKDLYSMQRHDNTFDRYNTRDYFDNQGGRAYDITELLQMINRGESVQDTLMGYQYGGTAGTVEDILEKAGLTPTPEQLALFEQFDPTQLQQVTQGLQQGLLGGTLEGQQHQAKAGFGGMGATKYGQEQQRKTAHEQFASEKTKAATAFESKTLGTAADIIAGGGEFNTYETMWPSVDYIPASNQGTVNYKGTIYVWSEEEGQYVPQ